MSAERTQARRNTLNVAAIPSLKNAGENLEKLTVTGRNQRTETTVFTHQHLKEGKTWSLGEEDKGPDKDCKRFLN